MKLLIVANWKMNPSSLVEARKLFNLEKKGTKRFKRVEVIICPPFVYLSILKAKGAQDVFYEEKGAFTGEVSPKMLKSLGVKYVILGHSERRKYLNETDEMVNKKLKAALEAGLKPILCIDNLFQLEKGLRGISEKIIIAYEPVFAIGTGKPCSPEKAKLMRDKIKYPLVLYGGSVNSQNAKDYIQKAGFQGLLVGGASLNPKEFIILTKNIDFITEKR